jgi:hypothetical protein
VPRAKLSWCWFGCSINVLIPQKTLFVNGEVMVVDKSEFAADKLANRGSLPAGSLLTNAQDFLVILERGLSRR